MTMRGKVTDVTGAGLYVLVADLHPTEPFGPCQYLLAGDVPEVGDMVAVANVGTEVTPDLIVLGGLS